MLSSGRDPTPGSWTHPEEALLQGTGGSRLLCSHFRLSHLVVLGFLPTSCATSAQPGRNPAPKPPWGRLWKAQACGVWGRGGQVAFSLPWSSLLSEWCCLPSPRLGVCLSVFIFVFIYIYKRLAQSPRPTRTAVNLSVVEKRLLCFCSIPNKTWRPLPTMTVVWQQLRSGSVAGFCITSPGPVSRPGNPKFS